MPDNIIIALISQVGTAIGSWSGVRAANKITVYCIEQLEKKMAVYNDVMKRMLTAEINIRSIGTATGVNNAIRV